MYAGVHNFLITLNFIYDILGENITFWEKVTQKNFWKKFTKTFKKVAPKTFGKSSQKPLKRLRQTLNQLFSKSFCVTFF